MELNRLTREDWQFLDRAHQFLDTFAEATLYAEGKSSISQPLLVIEILLKKFEDEKVSLFLNLETLSLTNLIEEILL